VFQKTRKRDRRIIEVDSSKETSAFAVAGKPTSDFGQRARQKHRPTLTCEKQHGRTGPRIPGILKRHKMFNGTRVEFIC
jgi:hypothetical protein